MRVKNASVSKKCLMLVMAFAVLVSSVIVFPQKASAHASYIGQRFGSEWRDGEDHLYVEFDIYYQEDWDEGVWSISPSSMFSLLLVM